MKNKKCLFISLGHNSSVVYYNGEKLIGYEQERIDNIKSSSASPDDALVEIIKRVGLDELRGIDVFISDWFDFGQSESEVEKYYSKNIKRILSELNCKIHRHDSLFTHHDAHAYSTKAFFNEHDVNNTKEYHVIVADGFGNDGEVISLYKKNSNSNDLLLQKRLYGYQYSMGLMYQYATSYAGMSENKDEYKFIAYETMIDDYLDKIDLNKLIKWANVFVSNTIDAYKNSTTTTDIKYSYKTGLSTTKEFVHGILRDAINDIYSSQKNTKRDNGTLFGIGIDELRSVVGYIVQYAIEKTLVEIIKLEGIKNLLVVGGIFNNVKLNKSMIDEIDGVFTVHPVAGDQGAPFGYYEKLYPNELKFGDFKYGERDLEDISKFDNSIDSFNISQTNEFVEHVSNLIVDNKVVNLVIGNLEFGPRALCNTSTICLPTMENVKAINIIDGRDDVMPMAPVILDKYFKDLFETNAYNKVVGSDKFMGVTYSYKNDILNNPMYNGVMLKYPHVEEYSGRPQIVNEDELVGKILTKVYEKSGYKCIINTSFNVHGRPIVRNKFDVISNNKEQIKNDKFNKIKTVVLC